MLDHHDQNHYKNMFRHILKQLICNLYRNTLHLARKRPQKVRTNNLFRESFGIISVRMVFLGDRDL